MIKLLLLINFLFYQINSEYYVVTLLDSTNVKIPNCCKHIRNYDERIKIMFSMYDYNFNNYLDYDELYIFQDDTEPNGIILTYNLYKNIIKLLKGDLELGLNFMQFHSSYYEYSMEMGTNITKDFNTLQSKFNIAGVAWNAY